MVTRRAFLGLCTVALAGCSGGKRSASPSPTPESSPAPGTGEPTETSAASDLSLTSPAFEDGEPMPRKYGYRKQNVNPPLRISGVPEAAKSLALIVDDPDAVEPAGKIWVHWLVWNIDPSRERIPEDWTPERAVQGTNDFGSVGYGGPAPPDERHTYRFRLYALDTTLDLASGAKKPELTEAMDGHVLAKDVLRGTYAPSG